MASARGVIAKLDAALRKTNVTDRAVYKRLITRTGGDDLIGRPGTVTYTDTKLDPPPIYQRLGRNIVGNNVQAQLTVDTSGNTLGVADDWAIIFSPSSITRTELENPNLVIVLKDAGGNEEVFKVTDFEPQAFQGIDIEITAYLRSVKRPS